jgi:branched-chain amino acid transport system substrate-binding protein
MKAARWRIIAAASMAVATVSGCSGGSTTTSNSGPDFVIGVAAAATGPSAGFGVPEFNAAKLVADQVNAAGGINGRKIKLINEDDQATPAQGVSIVQRLISQKADAILGSANSGVALAEAPIIEQAGMLYVTAMAANPAITINADGTVRKWVFRIAQSDTSNAEFMADYVFGHYQHVALMSDTTGYGAGGRQALLKYLAYRSLSNKLVADVQYATATPDVTAQLKTVADSHADALIIWGIIPDAATILRGLKSTGSQIAVFGLPGLDGTQICSLAQDAAIGLQHLDTWDPTKPEAKAASAEWQSKFNTPLDNYFGASSYDGMKLLVKALTIGGSDREKVRAAFESTFNYVGALGRTGAGISYSATNHDGLAKSSIVVKRVTDTACTRAVVG